MADPGDTRLDRRIAGLLFLAALAVRVLYTLLRDVGNPIPYGSDANSYDAFARAILAGTGWIAHPGPELFRPPGYPMALAVLYALTGRNMAVVQCLQSLIGAGSVVLIYNFGRRHAGRTAALLAAVWLLISPLHLDYNGKLLRETWLVFLNVALLASLLAPDGLKRGGVWRTALLFTVLAHFDSRYVFHLPFFGLYYALAAGGETGAAPANRTAAGVRGLKPAALFISAVLVLSVPWAARNAVAYDRFVLIDTRALDRWGRKAQAAVTGDAASPAELMARFEASKAARIDSLTVEEQHAFRSGIRPDHGQPANALFNLAEFWRIAHFKAEYRPFPDGRFASTWSKEHNLTSLLFMGLLLPAFIVAAGRILLTADRVGLVLIAFIAVHTLLHVLVHSVVRYRLPIEPFYAFLAFREMLRWGGPAKTRPAGA